MAAEKNFEDRVKTFLKQHNVWFIKYWGGGGFTKSGIPDIIACCYGWFLGIELKGPRGHPTDLQLYHLKMIDQAKGFAFLLYPDSFENFRTFVEQLAKYHETKEDRHLWAAVHLYHVMSDRWRRLSSGINPPTPEEMEDEDMAKKKAETEQEMEQVLGKLPPEMLVDPDPEEDPDAEPAATESRHSVPAPDLKEKVEAYLKKTGREGIEDLLAYMESIGYYQVPCSGGNHLAKEGGLAEHSMNVLRMAEKISVALIGGKNMTDDMRNSIVICALLHDLGKCGDHSKKMYVPNILKSGKASETKPFKRNPELSNVPHSVRSLIIANRWIDLTEEEEYAILYHDGLYDRTTGGSSVLPGHETKLSMIIHWADMWASHILEGVTDSEEMEG